MARANPQATSGTCRDAKSDGRRTDETARLVRRRIGQALRFQQRGEYPRAIRIYRWFLARNPDCARVLQIYGLALHRTGDLDGAVRILSRSVALDSSDSATHASLGNALYEQGRLEDALVSIGLAVEADPSSADAHNDRGNVLRDLGRLGEAIESYRSAIAINGALAVPHFNLGNALWDCDAIDEAIACYGAALDIDPEFAAAHNNLGNALRAGNDLASAVDSYAHAAACDATFVLARFNLANVLKDLGRDAEALSAYQEVLGLDPGNELARHMAAALSGERKSVAPEGFVRQVFDTYAGHFDSHLATMLDYGVPMALRDAVLGPAPEPGSRGGARFGRALDLGCGTGLAAAAFAGAVENFDGVDLSPRMLVEARRKNLYEDLAEGELVAHLRRLTDRDPPYDMVLAADSLIYIGDLAPVFAGVAGCLAANGVFAFSIELAQSGTFELRPTGRFTHSEAYIRTLAEAHGFAVETMTPTVIRQENDGPVNGALCVLRNAHERGAPTPRTAAFATSDA
jgi:predicted TPR repeat methyltransferase